MVDVRKLFVVTIVCLLLAVSLVSAGTAVFSKDPITLLNVLGFHEFSEQRYEMAESAFAKAAEVSDDAAAYHNAGVAAYHQGKLGAAREAFEASLERDENRAQTWHLSGLLAHELGDLDAAVRDVKEAFVRDQQNLNVRYDLAVLLAERFQSAESSGEVTEQSLKDLREARALYASVAEDEPGFANAAENARVVEDVISEYEALTAQ